MPEEISFKSSGIRVTDPQFRRQVELIPIGIKTPMELGEGRSEILQMHFDPISQAADNLRNLILTNNGERIGRFGYGANLRELTTELTSKDDFDSEAVLRIRDATRQSMPYVELDTFVSSFDDRLLKQDSGAEPGVARIDIRVTYAIPKLRVTDQVINVTLYCIG